MLKQLGFAAALLGGTLVMTPAMAQQTSGDPFIKQQEINQWRASKLVGVAVMGADQKKIGKIADVLVDHDGNAQTIVISVGGFLGIGSKDVAVPFNRRRAERRRQSRPTRPQRRRTRVIPMWRCSI
jgi:sporulation protein YlmC with PRC-barrel domain